ncbi:siderophore ferric iron reductase [Piscinibacter sp. HJYY11]|uniref:siderophore ferric iron reductase n=1 Tax=Piscinibacter sp. HJYY11 TaxID=2801333 RepID=UPI00191DDDE4|nr:siderophore ferric iron reductase [Piscinibacter sp. HJYY11]MBL0729241.1 siderophore ferric iron reductase [Piscinibacter sp. HJYY11]
MTTALHALLAAAARVAPGLAGRVVEPGSAAAPWHAETRLAALHRRWAAAHPEAGAHYAALRGWGLLVWQPAYLAVFGAHLADGQVDLERLSLEMHAGDVGGYAVAAHALRPGDEAQRLHDGARQLLAGTARLLPAWQALAPLQAKAARRTLADCVLAALLAACRSTRRPAHETLAWGDQWLAALGLHGEHSYFVYRDAAGAVALAPERKVCCLHFRRRGAERCSTCPRLAQHERVRRLHAEEAVA